ncbi:hypothetical protein FM996_18190 [Methylosinus sporium]|uniref:Uncharacterized protein n=1 Tax=Methylosinus sporium TaxID=428 RepID=A0A549SH99_METSR|nr:hypothetical protein [Methylosinus sporium]TRL29003.1 hypothetical protein FM996_18190 [Methylosinus sporium]
MLYKATIQILVDVNDEPDACDCIAETMRPLLREFSRDSVIVDWRYASDGAPTPDDGRGFEYAPQRVETSGFTTSHPAGESEIPK